MPETVFIGVAAVSEEPSARLVENAREFIGVIAGYRDRVRILLGGYWGLMRVIADEAAGHGVTTVFILPLNPPLDPPRRREFIPIYTNLDFPSRSSIMCRTADVLVALGGRIGSILEVLLAYDYGKPSIVVRSGYDTDRLEKAFSGYADSRMKARIHYVDTGREAALKALEVLGLLKASN